MRAYSVSLETEVYLSFSEIEALKTSALEGRLNFREVNEYAQREIPFELVCNNSQREYLEVIVAPPRTYFGDARRITFSINGELYEKLTRKGSSGDRFWGSGKLLLFTENAR